MLRWLRANTDLSFDVLLRNGGELHDEFAEVAEVFDASQLQAAGRDLVEILSDRDLGLIYSNTVTNGELLDRLRPLKLPVISHIHELEYWTRWETPAPVVDATRRCSDRVIAVSEAVKDDLVQKFGMDADRIEVIYGFIPVKDIQGHDPEEARKALCQRLGLAPTTRLVGGCGTADWRKGPEFLIQVAAAARRKGQDPAHFVWIGGVSDGPVWGKFMHDAARAGVGDRVHFLGVHKEPFQLFSALDVFLLTSPRGSVPLGNA